MNLTNEEMIEEIKRLEFDLKVAQNNTLQVCMMNKINIKKLTEDRYMASSLVVTIQDLNGKEVVSPIIIRDGFKQKTIDCLLAEVEKSRQLLLDYGNVKEQNMED